MAFLRKFTAVILSAVLFLLLPVTVSANAENNMCYDEQEIIYPERAQTNFAYLQELFPMAYDNPNPVMYGGEFHWGITNHHFLYHVFNPAFHHSSNLSGINNLITYELLARDNTGRILLGPDGHYAPAYLTVDVEAKTATITMREDVQIFWHDGVELTLDDLVFHFEIISHPLYTHGHWGEFNGTSIVYGADRFFLGETNTIEGLSLSDDARQLTIQFTRMPPSLLYGLLSHPVPRHHFEGICVSDMPFHEHSYNSYLSFGPFILEYHIEGEAFVFVANENYWRGRPKLDHVVVFSVHPEIVADLILLGYVDFINVFPIDWPIVGDYADHMVFLGRAGNWQSPRLHFTLGELHIDENGVYSLVARDDAHPITDPVVRRAIAYAIDIYTLDTEFSFGLSFPAESILSPFNALPHWFDPDMVGFSEFNLNRANQILDEAGYVRGADGYRLDLDGNPFQVNFGIWNTPANEFVFEFHQQNLREIGIRLELWNDSWTEFNVLTDYVLAVHGQYNARSRNSDLHMFNLGWSLGANPDPSALWGYDRILNVSRFSHPDMQTSLDDIASVYSWDPDFQTDAFLRFAQAFYTHVPAITGSWTLQLSAVNRRVANFSINRSTFMYDSFSWHLAGIVYEG